MGRPAGGGASGFLIWLDHFGIEVDDIDAFDLWQQDIGVQKDVFAHDLRLLAPRPKARVKLAMDQSSPTKDRARAGMVWAALICATALTWAADGQGAATQKTVIPDFAPSDAMGWLKAGVGDEFFPPATGPGPVVADTSRDFGKNFLLTPGNARPVRIADLKNPILQPWAAEQMKKANDEVLAGKVGFTARSRCWPHGVPGFLLYPVHPIFFIQGAKDVVMTWGQDFQLRHVYLNVPHSAHPKPSWYGESVGHYENGNTLVVDTVGFNDRTYIDNFRTPHTDKLHVVERFRLVNDGEMEVTVHVEDPGAFTMPWNAIQRYKRDSRAAEVPLHEMVCAENNEDHFNQGLVPIPQAEKADF